MNTKTITRLYEVKERIKELKAEEGHLNDLVLNTMLKDEVSTHKTSLFTVSVGYRKSYEMPQWFRDQEEELKLSKKKAQREAPVSKSPFLSFRARVQKKPAKVEVSEKSSLHI